MNPVALAFVVLALVLVELLSLEACSSDAAPSTGSSDTGTTPPASCSPCLEQPSSARVAECVDAGGYPKACDCSGSSPAPSSAFGRCVALAGDPFAWCCRERPP